MNGLPPHNQRRLNKEIKEHYGTKYADWYDLAKEMILAGATYREIRDRFSDLGVSVSIFTVHNWIKTREAEESAHATFVTSH